MGTHFKSINIQSFLKMKAVFILIAGLALTNAAPAADGNQLSYIENLINRLFHGVDPLQKCDPPCKNGGSCQPDNTCLCPTFDNWAYEGPDCSVGPCSSENTNYWPCYNAGNCHEEPSLPFGAECLCQSDCSLDPPQCFSGPNCEFLDQCKIDYEEDKMSCTDHGYCTNDDTPDGFTCLCEPGWLGDKCADQDVCYPNQCQNDGLCVVDENGDPKCECQDGYFGDKCQYADPCRITPCYNGGTCSIDDNLNPSCECTAHYEGPQCEEELVCSPVCLNGGLCARDRFDEKRCFCPPGYTGEQCENSACSPSPCYNGVTCTIDDNGAPQCQCPDGYNGDFCETNVCIGQDCGHGNCIIVEGQPMCDCHDGWTGDNCKEQEGTSEGPNPTTAEPTSVKPSPTTAEPETTTGEPEPTTGEPKPTTKEPEPTTKEPEPTTGEPEPTTKEPEPTTKEPEPTTAEPESTTEEGKTTTEEKNL